MARTLGSHLKTLGITLVAAALAAFLVSIPFGLEAALAVGVLLFLTGVGIDARQHRRGTPVRRRNQVLKTFSRLLSEAQRKEVQFEKSPDDGASLLAWEDSAESDIAKDSEALSGLFATADRVAYRRPVPPHLANDEAAVHAWSRLDQKIEWLRWQVKNGPTL